MTAIKIKPDTRLKDILIEKEKKRLLKRASEATSLKNLLASIPKVAPSAIAPAVEALMDAADQYIASQFLVDAKGRRTRPALAEGRESIARLVKELTSVQVAVRNLPINAKRELSNAYNAPLGKLTIALEQMCDAAIAAQFSMSQLPNKVPNHARDVLAFQVAVIFTDILKKTPSSARAKQLKENNPRGGAAYDRVLRATLKAAGVTDYDSGPLITAGLRLLKDPDLPSRN